MARVAMLTTARIAMTRSVVSIQALAQVVGEEMAAEALAVASAALAAVRKEVEATLPAPPRAEASPTVVQRFPFD